MEGGGVKLVKYVCNVGSVSLPSHPIPVNTLVSPITLPKQISR